MPIRENEYMPFNTLKNRRKLNALMHENLDFCTFRFGTFKTHRYSNKAISDMEDEEKAHFRHITHSKRVVVVN